MSEYLSLFKTKSAENLFIEKYDSCLKAWPVPYETEYIDSEIGLTHVIACGNKNAPVLVLMHGASATSAMWIPNIEALSEKYYIVAIDIPGDPNKSKMKRKFENIKDASDWLIDIIDKLNIDTFSLLGFSYGSFISMCLAIHHQQRVEKLIIISPTQSITKLKKKMWLWIIRLLLFPTDKKRRECLSWYNGGKSLVINNDYTEFQLLAMKDRKLQMTALVHIFSDKELKQLSMPVLLLIGSKEVVTDVDEVKKRSEKLIENLTFKVIDDACHNVSFDKSEIVNPIILDFLNSDR